MRTPMKTHNNRRKSLVMFRRVMTVPLVSLSALVLVGGPAEAAPAVPGGTPQVLDLGQPCKFPIQKVLATAKFPGEEALRTVLPNGVPRPHRPSNRYGQKSGYGEVDNIQHFWPRKVRPSNEPQSIPEGAKPHLMTGPNRSKTFPHHGTSGNVSFIIGQPIDRAPWAYQSRRLRRIGLTATHSGRRR